MTNIERWALVEELRALVERHHNGTATREDPEALYTNVERLLVDIAAHRPEPVSAAPEHPGRMHPNMLVEVLPVIAESIEAVIPEGWHFALCVIAPEAGGAIKCVTRGDGLRIHAGLTKVLAHVDVTRAPAPASPSKASN